MSLKTIDIKRFFGKKPVAALVLVLILLTALAIRVTDLKDLPAGLFCDEAALGYNAWSILHYGIDENGVFLPLFVWSFGGFKNPIYIYGAMFPIGVLGLDEFSLRLTSVLFGMGTIVAIYFLGAAYQGRRLGLIAAFLLAICPWHIHFSRVAFELISFPFLFVIALLSLLLFCQGRRTLTVGFVFAALCFYSYAISKVFVPLFLLGFTVANCKTLWKRRREFFIAALAFVLYSTPAIYFEVKNADRGLRYAQNASLRQVDEPWKTTASRFVNNYEQFFSKSFLFEKGDSLTRHAVKDHGELYPFMLPFLVAGIVSLVLSRRRFSKLFLWWIALYPVGASLMNEIPSASRGFMGSVALVFLASVGVNAFLAVAEVGLRSPWMRRTAMGVFMAGVVIAGFFSLSRYLDLYFHRYPLYSARGLDGFQFGYRDTIAEMEKYRGKYAELLMTARDVNQPYIFSLFYRRLDPREYIKRQDPGYLILDPAELDRFPTDVPLLYALRPFELELFTRAEPKKRIFAPDGATELIITEIEGRKQYVTDWSVLGPFAPAETPSIEPQGISKASYAGKFGQTYWQSAKSNMVWIDVERLLGSKSGRDPGTLNNSCAYAVSYVHSQEKQPVLFSINGEGLSVRSWLNEQRLNSGYKELKNRPEEYVRELNQGKNQILLRVCWMSSDPKFRLRLSTPDGKELSGVTYSLYIPEAPVVTVPISSQGKAQTVEGFSEILSFTHSSDDYADYRGQTKSWWIYGEEPGAELRWKTSPLPHALKTYVLFTASMSESPGKAELWANGQFLLSFDLGDTFSERKWERGPYRLQFLKKAQVSGSSGIFILELPEGFAEAGKPIELRAGITEGKNTAWFMIKNYKDTSPFEKIDVPVAQEILEAGSGGK